LDTYTSSFAKPSVLFPANQVLVPVFAGVVCQNTEEQLLPKLNTDDSSEPDPSSTLTTMDTQGALLQSKPASQEHSELKTKADEYAADVESSSVVTQMSNLASVLSRVIPKQMESMDAAQLRARWAELIDALEKERLGLPKIKTSSRKMGVTGSPRDSGGVKRIAEQMKSAHHEQQNDKDGIAPEDVPVTRARPLWSKVEQKQEVVF